MSRRERREIMMIIRERERERVRGERLSCRKKRVIGVERGRMKRARGE